VAPQPALAHERLAAYQVGRELDELVVRACRRMPRGWKWLVDQIQRASTSVVLNLVEANGRTGQDRVQQLKIARGSANEVDAALDLLAVRGLLKADERARGKALAVRFVRCVTGLIER
jgi:four helix bundle protein